MWRHSSGAQRVFFSMVRRDGMRGVSLGVLGFFERSEKRADGERRPRAKRANLGASPSCSLRTFSPPNAGSVLVIPRHLRKGMTDAWDVKVERGGAGGISWHAEPGDSRLVERRRSHELDAGVGGLAG